MDFGFNDEQREIQQTAKSFAADRYKPEAVRAMAEDRRYDDALWSEISELGWAGIAIADEHAGQGLGMVELMILCEEMGYACAPSPLLSNAAAGIALSVAGSDEQKAAHLPGIASGSARGTVGELAADNGHAPLVPDAEGADVIVLFGPEGATLLSDRGAAGIEPVETIDATRGYARVAAGDGEPLPGDADAARDRIAVAIAAELVGVAQRGLDMSVAYAKERKQFERPIGAYQGVSHACARMLYDVEEARSLTYYAAWAADAEPESLPLAAAMAKARANDAAWDVSKAAIQVHGGIGFTWESDLHFLLKRARASGQLFGSAGSHRDRVAALAGLG
jgi:alkylation response protein AidB-like acyl-CoA dehydrogenase